ncbi:ATP-binding protein [Cellulomonas sp. NPDC055163]
MSAHGEPGRDRPLVGRGPELDDLDDALSSVSAGSGSIMLLEGEAGVGKSSIAHAVRTTAHLLGLEVRGASASAVPRRPFALLAEALLSPRPEHGTDDALGPVPSRAPSPVEEELAALLDGARDAPAAPAVVARTEELFTALVRRRGDSGPWLLVLDDLHLADEASLAVLYRLAREGTVERALLLATMRPVPRGAELATVVAAWTRAGARYVELRPLAPAAVVELAESRIGAPAGPALRGALATTGGNPRFVADLVRALQDADALVPTPPGGVDVAHDGWTAPLDTLVVARLDYLGADVVALLARASVLGSSFVVGDLAELADLPVAHCWRILRHALAAGVVHARGDRLAFRHDLVRTALYAGLDPAERRDLHARAARALQQAGAPPAVVERHLHRTV